MSTTTFAVGAAIKNITPDRPLPNYNGKLLNRGDIDSDLLCHTVVFSQNDQAHAMVCCDLTKLDRTAVLRIREICEHKTGIPGENITISATHCHVAPAAQASFLAGERPDPLYMDFLINQVVESVTTANNSLSAATLSQGIAKTAGFESNRRFLRPDNTAVMAGANLWSPDYPPEGPVDPDIPFMAFEANDGRPLAFIVNYSCHNICYTGALFHRNLFGRIGDVLRKEYPSLKAVLVIDGAAGNVGLDHSIRSSKSKVANDHGEKLTWELAGKTVANIVSAYKKAKKVQVGNIVSLSKILELRDRGLEESTFCEDDCRGDTEKARAFARRRYEPERDAIKERGETSCLVELQAIGFGDVAIITNPFELFVEFGLEIKAASPFRNTLVACLTNGGHGYVPTKEAFEHGGYETHRTVFTSRLSKDAGDIIVQESLALLEQCKRLSSSNIGEGKTG